MTTTPVKAGGAPVKRREPVLDSYISYVEVGHGRPIVFLHGNPTSSYLWRNIIPHVQDLGRCLAPDLIGMGDSGPSPGGAYRFVDHIRYLDAWFEAVHADRDIVLVLHDWGSALGFHRAHRYPASISGVAYMEALVQPRLWSDFAPGRDLIFRALRSEDGERLALDENIFVEMVLPKSILRTLMPEEMEAYRAPFATRASRIPILSWARDLPIEGEPADVVATVDAYATWMATNNIPKLFISAEPGALATGRAREFCRGWPNQREVTVTGIHYVQEDSASEIGRALRQFIQDLV